MAADLHIDDSVTIPAAELSWSSARASGPGGQNVNKVATKIDLRFDLTASTALAPAVKARLRRLARGRLDADGRVVVMSQLTRSRARNLDDARERLAELVRRALVPPKKRTATKPSRGARERRLAGKHHRSKLKQRRTTLDD